MEPNQNNDDLENEVSDIPTISMPAGSEAENFQPSQSQPAQSNAQPQISEEEEIGIHKGALNTLLAERNELIKMLSNVEVIMQAHIARLNELGIEIKMKHPEKKE